jgi:hypothetical protein
MVAEGRVGGTSNVNSNFIISKLNKCPNNETKVSSSWGDGFSGNVDYTTLSKTESPYIASLTEKFGNVSNDYLLTYLAGKTQLTIRNEDLIPDSKIPEFAYSEA